MRGRPSKLTPDLQESICKTLTAGVDVETACVREGIGPSTFREWLRRGRDGEEPFEDFLIATDAAMANVETAVTANILKASRTQWGAAAWWLKWKHNRGATTQNVNVTAGGAAGGSSGPVQLSPAAADAIRRQILFGDVKPLALPVEHEGEVVTESMLDAELAEEAGDFGSEPPDPMERR